MNDTEYSRDSFYNGSLDETIVGSETIFEGRVFTVKRNDVILPSGKKTFRELVLHHGGASIVAIDDEGYLYLVEQYRAGAAKTLLELPAGKLESGEDPMECARRELLEETGMTAESIEKLAEFYPTPAYDSEKIYVYKANGLKSAKPHRDEGEFLHVLKIKIEDAVNMVKNGEIEDAKTIIGILSSTR